MGFQKGNTLGKLNKGRIGWTRGLPREQQPFFGGHHTNEAKEKIRLAKLKNNPGGFKKGTIPWNMGKKGRVWSEEEKKKLSLKRIGDKNPLWKGNRVSMSPLHQWVVRHRGRPQKCEHCLTEEKRNYQWANKSHQYKRDLEDWIRLCVPCHRKYDYEYRKSSSLLMEGE